MSTDTASARSVLRAAWLAALGRPPSGPDADFFAAGGDSLLVVRMVTELRRAGVVAGPVDVLRGRTFDGILRRIAAAGAGPAAAPPPGAGDRTGSVPLLPTQRRWLRSGFAEPDHFALAWVFRVPPTAPGGGTVEAAELAAAVDALVGRHAALRTRYALNGDRSHAEVLPAAPDGVFSVAEVDEPGVEPVLRAQLREHDLRAGRVLTARWLPRQRLLQVAAHHLTLDGYSLGVLADDLEQFLVGAGPTDPAAQPRDYAAFLATWVDTPGARADADRWAAAPWASVRPVPVEGPGPGLLPSTDMVAAGLDVDETAALLRWTTATGRSTEALVLAAAGLAVAEHHRLPAVLVDTYHHARRPLPDGPDLASAVGYVQASYPVVVEATEVEQVLDVLDRVPADRFGFDALRFAGRAELDGLPAAQVRLNFRSRMNELNSRDGAWLRPADVAVGGRRAPVQTEPYLLMVEADQVAGRLVLAVKHSCDLINAATARAMVDRALMTVRGLATRGAATAVPS
jgi:hypothetical protein